MKQSGYTTCYDIIMTCRMLRPFLKLVCRHEEEWRRGKFYPFSDGDLLRYEGEHADGKRDGQGNV